MRTVLLALALGACFVPPHRFDDPPPPDGAPPPDAPPVLFVTIPSGVSIQGGSSALELPEPMTNYDSQPVHRVFTSSYEITAGCVTEQQYFECVKGGGCPETPGDGGQIGLGLIDDTHADAYCRFIGARVPTEAELERAVRGDMGAKTLSTPSPFGLDSCDLGETTVIVADHYQCDAYVGRAWANPLAGGTGLHARLFQTDLVDAPIPPRTAKSPVYGIRCVRSLDATAPPLPPAQPTCTTGCDVSQLAIGEHFGCALRASGEVWCWGSNTDGELGTDDLVDAIPSSTARPVMGTAVEIAAGSRFACARTSAGVVACWGDNHKGQLGGGPDPSHRAPVTVASDAIDLAAAGDHGCVVLSSGAVACWGQGGASPAAAGVTQITTTPITGATAIAAGARSECAIVGTSVSCWGTVYDAGGTQLYVSPADARTFSIAATQIAAGESHWCAVVNDVVQCWGLRAHWGGGAGVATSPEVISVPLVAPKLFLSDTGTVIVDQGVVLLNAGTALPSSLAVDGDSIAFSPGDDSSGCATLGVGASCFGIERGQLGRSNGCDAAPATSALALP
jgi:hypothetical protein